MQTDRKSCSCVACLEQSVGVIWSSTLTALARQACSAELTSSQYFTMEREELEGLNTEPVQKSEGSLTGSARRRSHVQGVGGKVPNSINCVPTSCRLIEGPS